MNPRVIRFTLADDLHAITWFDILERRNPRFDGVTTGVLAGHDFFYMAKIQDGKQANFDPIAMLRLQLQWNSIHPGVPGREAQHIIPEFSGEPKSGR